MKKVEEPIPVIHPKATLSIKSIDLGPPLVVKGIAKDLEDEVVEVKFVNEVEKETCLFHAEENPFSQEYEVEMQYDGKGKAVEVMRIKRSWVSEEALKRHSFAPAAGPPPKKARKAFVIIGAPGTGKTTQAKLLVKDTKAVFINVGEFLREEAGREKGSLSSDIKEHINKGKLLPQHKIDDLVEEINNYCNKLIEENKEASVFIIEGMPKLTGQVKMLDAILHKHNIVLSKVISLHTKERFLIRRLEARGKKLQRPEDASAEAITARIQTYFKEEPHIIQAYAKRGILHKQSTLEDSEIVFVRLQHLVRRWINN